MPIAIIAISINQETFAIGDDYHALGYYFIMGGMKLSTAVISYWTSPYMAGRPFAAIAELLPLSFMGSVSQLTYVRYFHLLIFAMIFSLFMRVLQKCNFSSIEALIIGLFMFTIPGLWHLYLMNYGSSMLLAICAMLFGAFLTISCSHHSFKSWVTFAILAAFSIFSYQPAWPLLFAGLFGKTLITVRRGCGDHKYNQGNFDEVRNNSIAYVKALTIVIVLFILNFALVKFGYNSQRLSLDINLMGKLSYLFNDLLPITIFPWAYIWFPGNIWLKYLSWLTYFLSIIFIAWTLIKSINKARGTHIRINFYELILILSIATSLIPLTLGMFFFTEQAIAFRRVVFASMLFWFILLCFFLSSPIYSARKSFSKKFNLGALCLLTCYIFAFGFYLIIGTVQLASREWNSAVCASKFSPLTEPASLNTLIAISPKPFPGAWSGDEFQVRTFSYPTGGMLLWLAHWDANHAIPKFNRWNIALKEDLNLSDWDRAYLSCLSK